MRTRREGGFTLVEVLVAVIVTAVVALVAHQLFAASIEGSRRLVEARRGIDRASNARRFLCDAFLSLEVGADSAGPFEGDASRVRFSTWLPTSDGWDERRIVVLQVEGDQWIAADESAARFVLADSVKAVAFDYLLEPGADAHWVANWHSAVSAPLAVRVRLTHNAGTSDTMLYLIKARG